MLEWLPKLRDSTRKDIFAVGEYWAPGLLNLLLEYIKETTNGEMSLFDSSLHTNFHHASKEEIVMICAGSLMKHWWMHARESGTVVANHDTQPLQALEATVENWFKPIAYALILLRDKGYPCVFILILYGAHYKDKGKDGKEYEIWIAQSRWFRKSADVA